MGVLLTNPPNGCCVGRGEALQLFSELVGKLAVDRRAQWRAQGKNRVNRWSRDELSRASMHSHSNSLIFLNRSSRDESSMTASSWMPVCR